MPRENSFSDSDGRSLTPDLEDEMDIQAHSPTYSHPPEPLPSPTKSRNAHAPKASVSSAKSHPYKSSVAAAALSPSKQSLRSAPSTRHARPVRPNIQTPKEKFRSSVRKIMAMHRSTSVIVSRGGAGAEPGVDPRNPAAEVEYGGIKQDCVIQVIDYSAVRSSFGKMTNKEFAGFMDDPAASERESWVKVRWINVAGVSWDVVKAFSLKYECHPLALEDVFHTRSQTRSKADYYAKHLFLRVLCHELAGDDSDPTSWAEGSTLTDEPDSFASFEDEKNDYEMGSMGKRDESTLYDSGSSRMNSLGKVDPSRSKSQRRRRPPMLPNHTKDVDPKINARMQRQQSTLSISGIQKAFMSNKGGREPMDENDIKIEALKRGERINVKVSPMFIFLFRDGTVISMHAKPTEELTSPIVARLKQRDTGLRSSADPSLLVQSLLDLVVDKALEVIDAYHHKIKKFEGEVLMKPKMRTVKNLHILSGDLIMHRRTLDPIKTVIYGLRRYDLDRVAALIDSSDASNQDVKAVGFMSHKSKIYLADVHDHMDYILTSLDMFAGIAENLIDYTFNMASYEMNEVMRRLTLATIVFLPLTLTTGYFGMNFEFMSSVNGKSEWVFWYVAIPMMVVVTPIFTYPDIQRGVHHMKKKFFNRKLTKLFKSKQE